MKNRPIIEPLGEIYDIYIEGYHLRFITDLDINGEETIVQKLFIKKGLDIRTESRWICLTDKFNYYPFSKYN
jgi:hypothetical protein